MLMENPPSNSSVDLLPEAVGWISIPMVRLKGSLNKVVRDQRTRNIPRQKGMHLIKAKKKNPRILTKPPGLTPRFQTLRTKELNNIKNT